MTDMVGIRRTSRSSPSPLAHSHRASVDLAKSALSFCILEMGDQIDQNSEARCGGVNVRLQDDLLSHDSLLEGSQI